MHRTTGVNAALYYLALALGCICVQANAQIIRNYAGGGVGDGGDARDAVLSGPNGIAFDASGNLFVADISHHCIRKISASGIITTVAGNGTSGYSGDGGVATSAQLYFPTSVAVDSTGNIYIADFDNERVRKVSTNGIITTVAGNGLYGSSGDGGQATNAQLSAPEGVTIDATGNLYIAAHDNRIRKVSINGIITTVVGNGTYGYSGDGGAATSAELATPGDITFDSSANLYLADTANNRIRKVSTNGVITTVAGNGTSGYAGDDGAATSAELNAAIGIKIDPSGNLYIADVGNNVVRKVSTNGIITTLAGNGTPGNSGDGGAATSAQLNSPNSVAVDASGNVYIADTNNDSIRKVTTTGVITTFAGSSNGRNGFSSNGAAATDAVLDFPDGVAVDAFGNVYIADTYDNVVRKVSTAGVITTVAGTGLPGYSGDGGLATFFSLHNPHGVSIDSAGSLYIADTSNNRIRKVSPAGSITTVAGNGTSGYSGDDGVATSATLHSPWGVAVDALGNLYIADGGNNCIRKVVPTGTITTVAGTGTQGYAGDGGAATIAELNFPDGIAIDASGTLYVADAGNNRVRKVATSGTITTVAGNGATSYSGDGGAATSAGLFITSGVAIDTSGNLYIADTYNYRVRKVSTDGIIATVAGNGAAGDSGDGGVATSAKLFWPQGIAVDMSGNLFIADSGNNRIREVLGDEIFKNGFN